MITDRTQIDIDNALKIRDDKVKAFKVLSENDRNTLERGMLTINTLNRIEEKQAELKNLLIDIGYYSQALKNKTWTNNNMFTEKEFQRIINNEIILTTSFFLYKDTPKTLYVSFDYENINSIEKILVDLDVMINDVKSNYRECGTFKCGEE